MTVALRNLNKDLSSFYNRCCKDTKQWFLSKNIPHWGGFDSILRSTNIGNWALTAIGGGQVNAVNWAIKAFPLLHLNISARSTITCPPDLHQPQNQCRLFKAPGNTSMCVPKFGFPTIIAISQSCLQSSQLITGMIFRLRRYLARLLLLSLSSCYRVINSTPTLQCKRAQRPAPHGKHPRVNSLTAYTACVCSSLSRQLQQRANKNFQQWISHSNKFQRKPDTLWWEHYGLVV